LSLFERWSLLSEIKTVNMRLNNLQIDSIKTEIYHYDDMAEIYLFGSRVDDKAKGGDIDLLVISKKINLAIKLKILVQLLLKLGEQKIDLITVTNKDKTFTQVAINNGVLL